MTMRAEHSGTTFESGAPHVTVWTGFDGLRKMEIGGDGLRLSTSKSISGTTGQFTLELLPRDGIGLTEKAIRSGAERLPLYLSAIAPNTPISIGFEREGGVMLGLVRSCDWTTFAVGDKLQDGITITGTDFGHMLDDHILQMQVSTADHARWTEAIKSVLGPDAPILKELVGAEGPVNAAGERSLEGVTVQAVAEYCLKRVAGMRVPVLRQAFGGRGYIGDFTEVRASSFDGDLVYKTGLFTQETTVSGYLQEILDKDFYEFRMDTLPPDAAKGRNVARPVLVIRPKPFDEEAFQNVSLWPPTPRTSVSSWERLTTMLDKDRHHQVDRGHVVGQVRLGRSRDEAFSFYTVQNNNELGFTSSNASSGAAFPLYDLYNGTRFITQRYDSRCSQVAADPKKKSFESLIGQSLGVRRNRLHCWYRANPDFVTGSLRVRGKDSYRVGDPVWIPWLPDPLTGRPGIRAYCTAVNHEWSFGGGYACTLSLSRGHGPGFWEQHVRQVKSAMPLSLLKGWVSADR